MQKYKRGNKKDIFASMIVKKITSLTHIFKQKKSNFRSVRFFYFILLILKLGCNKNSHLIWILFLVIINLLKLAECFD